MKNSKDDGFWANLDRPDRRILILFFFLLIIILTPIIVTGIPSWKENPVSLIISILSGLIFTFPLTGILVFVYYYKRAIIPTRTILSWFLICVFIFSAVANVIIYLLTQMRYFSSSTILLFDLPLNIYNIPGNFFVLFLYAFLIPIVMMSAAFGMVWMLAVVEKSTISYTLVDITNITSSTSDSMLNKLTRGRYLVLQWLFNIPNVLDTNLLTINRDEPKKRFPWKAFKTTFLWASFLGVILAILMVHYGKSLAQISIENMFAIVGFIAMMIPILILSWFIFLRLDARIKGPIKDFKLFNGLKSRVTHAIVTFGTLVIFIRLVLEKTNIQQLFLSFINFYPAFLVFTTLSAFIYFNYFENDLAKNVANRYRKIE